MVNLEKKINVVILAAGKGTRMVSTKPKVLHQLAGKPLLKHVIDCAKLLNPAKIIVIHGYGGEEVQENFKDEKIVWVEQKEQLGTGHAVLQAKPYLDNGAKCLILLGDVPLINLKECNELIKQHCDLSILTVIRNDPSGYGRIIRDISGNVLEIVEQKDASPEHIKIKEVNTGIMALEVDKLSYWIDKITNHNAQNEYYLTDLVKLAVNEGCKVGILITEEEYSVEGINSQNDLAKLERIYQEMFANKLMQSGVKIYDPSRIDVRGNLVASSDVEIDVGCIFIGNVTLENNVKIGPYCVIKDATIGNATIIEAYTHIDGVKIGNHCKVGPFARLRPGTQLNESCHIGNFVEVKNSQVDSSTNINHLSYIGDSTIGKNVNIGAGTITCNYDGAKKHRTIIEDNVFVGSDSQLVAPVKIKAGATIGAGSTITKDVEPDELAISRSKQITITGWKRPKK